jgi:hypothetical protein
MLNWRNPESNSEMLPFTSLHFTNVYRCKEVCGVCIKILFNSKNRGGSVSLATSYGLEGPRFESLQGWFSLLQIFQTGSWSHPAPYSVGMGRGVNLTSYLRLEQRLRMSGVVPLVSYTPSCREQGNFSFSFL